MHFHVICTCNLMITSQTYGHTTFWNVKRWPLSLLYSPHYGKKLESLFLSLALPTEEVGQTHVLLDRSQMELLQIYLWNHRSLALLDLSPSNNLFLFPSFFFLISFFLFFFGSSLWFNCLLQIISFSDLGFPSVCCEYYWLIKKLSWAYTRNIGNQGKLSLILGERWGE